MRDGVKQVTGTIFSEDAGPLEVPMFVITLDGVVTVEPLYPVALRDGDVITFSWTEYSE